MKMKTYNGINCYFNKKHLIKALYLLGVCDWKTFLHEQYIWDDTANVMSIFEHFGWSYKVNPQHCANS